jgi:hypothetical protein
MKKFRKRWTEIRSRSTFKFPQTPTQKPHKRYTRLYLVPQMPLCVYLDWKPTHVSCRCEREVHLTRYCSFLSCLFSLLTVAGSSRHPMMASAFLRVGINFARILEVFLLVFDVVCFSSKQRGHNQSPSGIDWRGSLRQNEWNASSQFSPSHNSIKSAAPPNCRRNNQCCQS